MRFSTKEREFILKECNIKVNERETDRGRLSKIFDVLADIEAYEANRVTDEEFVANGYRLNERGEIAARMVTRIGWSEDDERELPLHLLTDEMIEFIEKEIGFNEKQIFEAENDEDIRYEIVKKLSDIRGDEKAKAELEYGDESYRSERYIIAENALFLFYRYHR